MLQQESSRWLRPRSTPIDFARQVRIGSPWFRVPAGDRLLFLYYQASWGVRPMYLGFTSGVHYPLNGWEGK